MTDPELVEQQPEFTIEDAIAVLSDHDARLGALEAGLETLHNRAADRTEFTEWVETFLIPTFALRQRLQHWEDEPALVSELTSLHEGYLSLGGKPSFDPMVWHSYLASAIVRFEEHRNRRIQENQNAAQSFSL